jgi:hypothetical protein
MSFPVVLVMADRRAGAGTKSMAAIRAERAAADVAVRGLALGAPGNGG